MSLPSANESTPNHPTFERTPFPANKDAEAKMFRNASRDNREGAQMLCIVTACRGADVPLICDMF